ncbi:MAG: AmmeMemoRadiSam system protein B [Syntrophaceae bacterium]
MEAIVRKPAVAGSWYPGSPEMLRRDVHTFLEDAAIPQLTGKPVAVISPHAGYIYSGPVAGYAYKAVQGRSYKRVVVISPSHRASFPFLSIWAKGGYETPLGLLEVDEEFCALLLNESENIQGNHQPHLAEHALEIQLPFLQVALGTFKLCPIIMGQQHISLCRELGNVLARSIEDPRETLVVASSDLSHFHHSAKAAVMDSTIAKHIETFDIEGLNQSLETGAGEACGGGPIISAMVYAQAIGRTTAQVLKYANSGDITGERTSVVGYLAAVIS